MAGRTEDLHVSIYLILFSLKLGDFLVAKTLLFHCRLHRFSPCLGTKIPHAAQRGLNRKEEKIRMTRISRQVMFPYYFLSHVMCMSVIKSNVEHLRSHPT